jgi:2,4-didehydro-3-deoxy-L-rhamnonate hydrolase
MEVQYKMRLLSFDGPAGHGFGRLEEESVVPMGADLLAYLSGAPVSETKPLPLSSVRLLAPVPNPGKVVCIGLNYRDHARESGQPLPEEPVLFAKYANSVIGSGEPIVIPPVTEKVDYEAELCVVIGRMAYEVAPADALDFVAGYTCANDVSARDLQFRGGQWTRGKTVDTFLPTGPWLVTTEELPDPQSLGLRCLLNGHTMQESNTSQMVFGVAQLISFISQTITLLPGDLIATGTPSGVGYARKPPVYLRAGDVVTIEIAGIGSLVNPVRRR